MILALLILATAVALVYAFRTIHARYVRRDEQEAAEYRGYDSYKDPAGRPVGPRHSRDGQP